MIPPIKVCPNYQECLSVTWKKEIGGLEGGLEGWRVGGLEGG